VERTIQIPKSGIGADGSRTQKPRAGRNPARKPTKKNRRVEGTPCPRPGGLERILHLHGKAESARPRGRATGLHIAERGKPDARHVDGQLPIRSDDGTRWTSRASRRSRAPNLYGLEIDLQHEIETHWSEVEAYS